MLINHFVIPDQSISHLSDFAIAYRDFDGCLIYSYYRIILTYILDTYRSLIIFIQYKLSYK